MHWPEWGVASIWRSRAFISGAESRRPTLLSTARARELEAAIAAVGLRAAARGRVCWAGIPAEEWRESLVPNAPLDLFRLLPPR